MAIDPGSSNSTPRRRLSAEQADLVHRLYDMRVPAPAVAQVIGGMLVEPDDPNRGLARSPSLAPTDRDAPPAYGT